MRLSPAFAVWLFGFPAAAESPFLAAALEDGIARTGPADARAGQAVHVHLVVPLGRGRYLTSARGLVLSGHRVPAEALVRPDAATARSVVWSRIEPRMFHVDRSSGEEEPRAYSNSVLFGPHHGTWRGVDPIEYFESPIGGATGFALTLRSARPSDRRFDRHGGLGVMRLRATASVAGRGVATPGLETAAPNGIGDDVLRVTFRAGDDFRGWLTSFHNVPNVFGSAGRGGRHQTARYVGTDCADVLVGALRRATGRPYEFTSVSGLSRLTRTLAELRIERERLTDLEGAGVRVGFGDRVQPGDVVLIDYGLAAIPRPWAHVGVLWADRSPPGSRDPRAPDGLLGPEDLLAHTAFLQGLSIEPLGGQAPARIRIVRWTDGVQRMITASRNRSRLRGSSRRRSRLRGTRSSARAA